MKPISTLRKPLRSVDVGTKGRPWRLSWSGSDVCAVPAAGVVGEAMMAIVLAQAFLDKFGGDSVDERSAGTTRDTWNTSKDQVGVRP